MVGKCPVKIILTVCFLMMLHDPEKSTFRPLKANATSVSSLQESDVAGLVSRPWVLVGARFVFATTTTTTSWWSSSFPKWYYNVKGWHGIWASSIGACWHNVLGSLRPFYICSTLGSFCCFRTSKNWKVAVRKQRIACLLVQALPWLRLLGSAGAVVAKIL